MNYAKTVFFNTIFLNLIVNQLSYKWGEGVLLNVDV